MTGLYVYSMILSGTNPSSLISVLMRYILAFLLAFFIVYPCHTAVRDSSKISTKYFDFFFPQSDRKTAEVLVGDADVLAKRIMEFMDLEFTSRITVKIAPR